MFTDMTIKFVKLLLSVHYANAKKIALKRKSLTTSRNESDEYILRSRNISIDQFLYKIV